MHLPYLNEHFSDLYQSYFLPPPQRIPRCKVFYSCFSVQIYNHNCVLSGNLDVVDGQCFSDNRDSIMEVTRAIQDVSEIQQRNITVLVRHKVQGTSYALDTVWTMPDHTPVHCC